ncbi:MAG TPA: thioesterase domain-containing protein, partial [Bryobacteraceae bacterium]|nr:thioesterase domain-containing protein [Bryobacteraceae bacterium]
GHRDMPQSVSVVGLARKGVFPQNNLTTKCCIYNTVVLGAVRFLVSLSAELNRDDITLGSLLEAPTIAEMAVVLSKDYQPSNSGVVPIQPRGSRIPLFLIGAQIETRHLAEALDPDQPVFVIRIPQFEDLPKPPCIQSAAAYCIAALTQFRPRGPYLLAGWCASGVIAFEMACLLQAAGEDVRLVALFDARNVLASSVARPNASEKIRFHAAHLRNLPVKRIMPYLMTRARAVFRTIAKEALPEALDPQENALSLALRTYQPRPYYGRLVHFWATDRPSGTLSQLHTEWRHVSKGQVAAYEVEGDHNTMWQPPTVYRMAKLLAAELQHRGENFREQAV